MNLLHRTRTTLGLVSFCTLACAAPAAEKFDLSRIAPVPATEQIPVMDFFRPAILQEPKLNPSGTHIAAIVTAGEDKHQLLVYDLKTQKIEMAGGSGDKDIYQVNWLNDARLVFSLSSRKMYGLGFLAADVGSISRGYPLLQYCGSNLVSVPVKDRLHPLVWNRYDALSPNPVDLGVAVVQTDIKTGVLIDLGKSNASHSDAMDARDNNLRHIESRYPVPHPGITFRYLTDKEGQLAYSFTSDEGRMAMFRLANKRWEKCPVDLEHIDVIDAADEAGQVVVLGPRQEGQPRALQLMDAATGQLGAVLLQDPEYDFHGWLYRSPATHQIMGANIQRNGPKVSWFNEDYRNLQKLLEGYFPGLVVRIIGSDEAQKLFLIATSSDRQPVTYSWVDLEKRSAGLFKNSAPWIDPQRMRPMNIIKYKTRDGRRLDAYLTLPAGASKENPAPLVVLAHGGPWVRDTWGYDGEVQFLANRGYAVLQPNYRGSPGYNWMFPEEDEWDFRKMHDDVTDATKTMIASGLIDSGRIAIMGGSFGGYLAVSGIVNEPALYRCAVTMAGVFDWEQLIKDKKYNKYESPTYGRMLRKLGDPKQQPEKFDSISPGRHADQIRVPVFVSGGKDDQTVEIEQSKTLISALNRFKVPHETYIVSEEGHGMAHFDKRVELYTRIESFLAKNLTAGK
ncbi:MAG: S9 family peptidase [Opitutaceae bacterium]|nr:S9 family peptidase [Opitutaceae bacterium]